LNDVYNNPLQYDRKKVAFGPFYIGIALLSTLFIYPLIYTLLTSFKTNGEIFSNYFGLPESWRFENYAHAWVKGK